MKVTINKEQFNKLNATQQGFAEKVEGKEEWNYDTAAAIAAAEKLGEKKGIESEHRKSAEQRVKDLENQVEQLKKGKQDGDKNNGDKNNEIDPRIAKAEKERDELKSKIDEQQQKDKEKILNSFVDEQVSKLANEIFTDASTYSSLIKSRVKGELVGGVPVIQILDETGNVVAGESMTDLKKSFLENKAVKGILKADLGSGSGATQSVSSGGSKTTSSGASPNSSIPSLMGGQQQNANALTATPAQMRDLVKQQIDNS